MRDHDLTLMKADKYYTVILITKEDHDQNYSEFLSNSKCQVSSVDSDFNFCTHVAKVRSLVKASTSMLMPSWNLILSFPACTAS